MRAQRLPVLLPMVLATACCLRNVADAKSIGGWSPGRHHYLSATPSVASSKCKGNACLWGVSSRSRTATAATANTILRTRGGAVVTSDDESYDEYDSESEYDSEYDEYDSDEESDDEQSREEEGDAADGDDKEAAVVEYDEPLHPSFMQSLAPSIGVMYLSRKIDLFDPKVVKTIRFAFVAYAIVMQIFMVYVRIKAKIANDRTTITVKNPMSSLLQKQLPSGEGGTNDMVKSIASQFLQSETTVMEYDLKEAKKMGNSLFLPMIMLWFVHFKMGQVQPLLFQLSSGILNLVYSPLFQVYVLGRNLERPFKAATNPMAEKMMEMQKQQQEQIKKQQEEVAAAGASATPEAVDESGSDEEESDSESESDDDVEEASDSDSDED
jgi:hypothetical protein